MEAINFLMAGERPGYNPMDEKDNDLAKSPDPVKDPYFQGLYRAAGVRLRAKLGLQRIERQFDADDKARRKD